MPSESYLNPEDRIPRFGQGELPPYQQHPRTDREYRRRTGRRRCVHYHTHYHAHFDSHPRKANICAKATRAAAYWWHRSHSHGRSHKSCPGKGSNDLDTVRATTRGIEFEAQTNRIFLDNLSDVSIQHTIQHGKRARPCGPRPKSDTRPRLRHNRRNSVEHYPWLHPYLRAGQIIRVG